MSAPTPARWLPYPTPRPGARLRLLCFLAGRDGRSAFHGWLARLPPWVEAWLFHGPDGDTPSAEALVRSLCAGPLSALDRPFALFGHGAGALLAVAAAHRLRRERGLEPVHLFLWGQAAPPAEAVHDSGEPAAFPITVVGDLDDDATPWQALAAWREQTTGAFRVYLLPAGPPVGPAAEATRMRLLLDGLEAPNAAAPATGEVAVWRVALGAPVEPDDPAAATLSADERERARRFHRAVDRARYITTRTALRSIVAQALAVPPEGLRFGYTAYGKPFLPGPPGAALHFNVSHADGLALIAVARGGPVGIDVERVRPDTDIVGVARLVFSAVERSALDALSAACRREAFFELWSLKEAYLKCAGLGFSGSPERVTVAPALPARAGLVEAAGDGADGRRFVARLCPAPGYTGAVAVEGECSLLCCRDWVPD